MTENQSSNQSSKTEKAPAHPGKIVVMGAGAIVLAMINMSTGTEAHSTAVKVLEYAGLGGGLVALVGGLVMMMQGRD